METVAALFSAIARSLRGLFDLASMAVGVAPTSVGLADAACVPTEDEATANWTKRDDPFDDERALSQLTREALGLDVITLSK